jgi:hypothetical protein
MTAWADSMGTLLLLACAALGATLALRGGVRLLAVTCVGVVLLWLAAWATGAVEDGVLGAVAAAASCQVGFFLSVVAQSLLEGRGRRHSRIPSPR